MDIENINEGRFEDIIKTAIEESDYFLLVLTPTTLESVWVVKEIQYALEKNRRIIPLLVDGFKLQDLPNGLEILQTKNAITVTPEYFQAAIERLVKFMGINPS